MGALCDPQAKPPARPTTEIAPTEISRERAIEIARKEVDLKADSVEAVRATSEFPGGQDVWRVTFKGRLPDQPPGFFETRVVEIDVRTGKVVSLSTS